jgi:hypothetical protein
MRMSWCLLLALAAPGCSKATSSELHRGGSGSEGAAGAPDPCSPSALKLPSARPLAVWHPPAGCAARGGGDGDPLWIASDAEAGAAFGCGAARLGVDFTKTALVVVHRTLSPAELGVAALDDGAAITIVERMRRPCPGERPPMPVPSTTVFEAPAGGSRAFADAQCTVDASCR